MTNLNIRPYFDDYDENKQFYQILFRPSYAIQARELNQMQTILQEQIARHGRNIFKEGSMVIPGQLSIDTSLNFIKLDTTYNGSSVDAYLDSFNGEGVELIGATSGIRATVTYLRKSTDSTLPTLWIKYIASGNSTSNGIVKTFQPGEVIYTNGSVPVYATINSLASSIGVGSSANIQNGVYFVNGRFVLAKEQTILLDDYTNTPSYRVGLQIIEDFISPEEDATLYDNAQGSTNYAAPGAHRYFIDLVLTKFGVSDTTDKSFIELLRVNNGVIESKVVNTQYSLIDDAMARRTYDESGNYTVKDFTYHVKEHRNNDRGAWAANTVYLIDDLFTYNGATYLVESNGTSGLTPPSHTIGSAPNGGIIATVEPNPFYNQGIYSVENGGDANSMALQIEPGKGYVLGYEIEKIGTSTVSIPKATTYKGVRNATIQTHIGSYIKVENIFGSLDVTSFPTVSLRSLYTSSNGTAAGTEVGTAIARYMEYDSGTIGTAGCRYILSLTDIKMNDGMKFDANVHQIYFANTLANFTCDIAKDLVQLTGTFTSTNTSQIVTGNGTKFTTELNVGDAIFHYNATNTTVLDPIFYVQSIESDTQLTATANVTPNNNTNLAFYTTRPVLVEGANDSLVYSLPTSYTRKVKDLDDEGTTNISYYVRKFYTNTASSNQIIISTASSAETFANPQQPDAFHVVNATTGAVIAATVTLNSTSNTATISLGTTTNGNVINVIATTKKTLKERTKTITRGYSEDFLSSSITTPSKLTLGKVDGIRLLKVYEFTDSGGTPVAFGSSIPSNSIAVDITSRYKFDSGCKDAYYDFASITNTTSIAPRSPIRVVYDYHEHSTTGDYFTIDSYQKTISENYTIKGTNQTVSLFDCIDFRPTKTGASTFSATNIPAIGFDVIADYTYYLPRLDNISLSSTGEFVLTMGSPAEVPIEPTTPENCMLLYKSAINPAIVGTPTVIINRIDNRRYTMRDIGALENRLSNVEYYTSLSLLESQTKNLQLFDSTGNVSFKNGFLVDSLTDQTVGDTTSSEYKCSIDVSENTLRPSFSNDNLNLIEKATTNSDRLVAGYVLQNGIATLPYTTQSFATQPFATTTESVTPYIKLNYIGDAALTPSSDDWYETAYKPDVIVNQEGNFDALVNQYRPELGTVWNAWQTIWVGKLVDTYIDRLSNGMWNASGRGSFGTRTLSVTNINEVGQVRTGTNTYVKAVYSTTQIADKVVSVDIIPFIRARTISFYASGLKPNTLMIPFFDQTDVSPYVSAASKITLTSKNGTFDSTTSAGADSDNVARSLASQNNAISVGLSTGDIIHNGASGNISLATATAIVKIDEDDGVRVINLKGTFSPGQIVYGTISGAYGTVYSVEASPKLVTNIYGELAGTFSIPSSNSIKFRSGQRLFTLTDSTTNSVDYTTKASTIYVASGLMENRQKTIVSTRNGVLAQETVSQNRTTTQTTITTIPQTTSDYYDPLAQSFKTPVGNGLFVDSVDFYFAGKDRSIPLYFEIREMSNGLPTTNVLPGSRVSLKPSQVNVSDDASVMTRIKTNYPIYLDGDTEYCFVLISDSPYYRVWVSQVGQDDVSTGQRISKQPYLGSLFKSQNASTWTPDQLEDIKFSINRCVFKTNAANIKFANQKLDTIKLASDAFYTKSGSSKLRIRIPNHGIPVGSNVVISGLTSSINGISAANINGTRTVTSIGQDNLVVTAGANATLTGNSNMSDTAYVSKHIKFDVMNLISSQVQFPGTSIQHFSRCIDTTYSMANDAIELIPSQNVQLNTTWMVASSGNEVSFNSANKSLEVVAQLQTTSDYLSPVLDIDRYSLILIGNRIDINDPSVKNIDGLDDVVTSGVSITFSSTGNTITDGSTLFPYVKVGQQINITGASNSGNNGKAIVTSVSGNTLTLNKTLVSETATCTFTQYNRYFDEISENGTSTAKYPMKSLNLNAPATDLRVFMDVSMFSPANFDLYYRTASNGAKTSGLTWKLASPVNPVGYASSNASFLAAEYLISDLVPFTSVQIKIVMKSTVSNIVPSFKNIRLIASS
ncbi:MAG TPA: DUF4815 domain-containing protein [Methanosarcina sp.]|nr:DUF4815 domain-containing protein [Methanosarcina sp.]